ncbi:MAG: hypothetical protein ACTSO9_15390 [Candidatus Helarchaeota archaeon]
MELDDEISIKQKGLENFILLLLGALDKPITHLHLQKEVFLLWNFHPYIKDFINFIKHYRGPFSRKIQETILHPIFLESCWIYTPPKNWDDICGGNIRLTQKGKQEYINLEKKIKEDEDLIHLLSGIKIVRQLYEQLSCKELLLLIYDTYPNYTKKSSEYQNIIKDRMKLSKGLIKKGLIDKERYLSLIAGES